MADQLPPADELHAVRADIERLTKREKVLRNLMITDPSARTGNRYIAVIKEGTRNQPDIKELRAAYPDAVAEHTHCVPTITVVLDGITEDGEIVSLRRKTAA